MSAARSVLSVYQDYLRQGQLAYQYSQRAGRAVFFPREVCPFTGSTMLEWRVSAGQGTIYSTSMVHRRGEEPYNVALIDMDEGFRLMARVMSHDAGQVKIKIGARVRFEQADEHEGTPFPVFAVEANKD